MLDESNFTRSHTPNSTHACSCVYDEHFMQTSRMIYLCHPHQISEELDWKTEHPHICSIYDHDPVFHKVATVAFFADKCEDPVDCRV